MAAAPDVLPQVQATEINLLRALVQQGVLPEAKAQEMLRKAGMDPALLRDPSIVPPRSVQAAPLPPPLLSPAPPPGSILIPEETRKEIVEEVHQDVRAQARAESWANKGSIPLWVQRLDLSGDVRLRYLRNDFAADNSPASSVDSWYQLPARTTVDTLDSHEHLQLRARLNMDAKINDSLRAGIRLVTAGGNDATASPVDYDVELGRYGRPFSAGLSLAYLQWHRGKLQLAGGRMPNPYFRSDLIFAPELSLDGASLSYEHALLGPVSGFAAAGVHPLQTNQSGPFNTASGQWLYAAQAGLGWEAQNESRVRGAFAYYDFAGIQGSADPVNPANNNLNDKSAPLFRQLGNTMFDLHYQVQNTTGIPNTPLFGYAAQFRLVNLGAEYEYARFDPLRLAMRLDWVRNVGFDATEIRQRLGAYVNALPSASISGGVSHNGLNDARTNGYLASLRMGASEVRQRGDWQLFGGARYLERDAVPDAFTSPDYRLGGTDNRAAFFGVVTGLSPSVNLTLRYVSARSIDSGPKFGVDSLFVDIDARF